MPSYQLFSVLLVLCGAFSYINHRFIKWPPTIGIMVLSLVASLLVLATSAVWPPAVSAVQQALGPVDFSGLLLRVLLSFLLFAGGFQLHAERLARHKWTILLLATMGTLMSTAVVGLFFYWMLPLFGLEAPLLACLLFGTVISPTDPIAVLPILKRAGIAPSLEAKIAGESLFNDGVAVVLFTVLLGVAASPGIGFSLSQAALLFVREAFGGAAFGLALGLAGSYLLRSIDDYKIEIMLTIAMVTGGTALAVWLHISAPIAMVVAGIFTGSRLKKNTVSGESNDARYLGHFWELTDEVLNALLFMLVGFELLRISLSGVALLVGCAGIAVVLAARWISVALPVLLLRRFTRFQRHAIGILTWGGLRGGLSVAMALSIPAAQHRSLFVTVTYVIVVFSVVVQGLSIGRVAKRLNALPGKGSGNFSPKA